MDNDEHDDGELWIPAVCLDYLRERLDKLGRRARKLGCDPARVEVLDKRVREWQEPVDSGWMGDTYGSMVRTRRQAQVLVRVTGEAPALAGWELVAVVEHTDAGNLIHRVPGKSDALPEGVRTAKATCDHCGHVRGRRETFIVKNTDAGETRRVGRSCLADFLGHVDPKRILGYAKYMLEIERECSPDAIGSRMFGHWWDLSEVLSASAACILAFGWVSRGMVSRAVENDWVLPLATADRVLSILTDWSRVDREDREALKAVAEQTVELVSKTLAWATELPAEGDEYLANLGILARVGTVEQGRRQLGLSVSMVSAYRRSIEKAEHKEKVAKERAKAGPAPTGRARVKVEIIKVDLRDTPYGATLKMLGKLENGSRVWCTAPALRNEDGARIDFEKGNVLDMTATWEVAKDDKSFAFGKRPKAHGMVNTNGENDA